MTDTLTNIATLAGLFLYTIAVIVGFLVGLWLLYFIVTETKKFIRIPLEERGSFLWGLIDGKMTTLKMAEAFLHEFPAEDNQVPERVATYLYQMVDNGLIGFVNFKA